MKKDKIDDGVIELLRENGRTPNNEIAQKLSISEGTVRNRIRKLTEGNFLKVKGICNPNAVKENQLVFLGAKVAVSKDLRKTARAVSKLPYVISVTIVSGRYDLMIEVFAPHYEIISFISDNLSAIGSIVSTESFMALESTNKWV
jgi:Lrp/AsnC family transcriptional regulator for asnA, asnC and gidA